MSSSFNNGAKGVSLQVLPPLPVWWWSQTVLLYHVLQDFKACGLIQVTHQEQQLQYYKK